MVRYELKWSTKNPVRLIVFKLKPMTYRGYHCDPIETGNTGPQTAQRDYLK